VLAPAFEGFSPTPECEFFWQAARGVLVAASLDAAPSRWKDGRVVKEHDHLLDATR
jgi:hypothetical protein